MHKIYTKFQKVILLFLFQVVATNICGSDQHMVRGRTTAAPGLVLGHEITGNFLFIFYLYLFE